MFLSNSIDFINLQLSFNLKMNNSDSKQMCKNVLIMTLKQCNDI